MTAVLAAAVVLSPPVVKYVDIDRFDTPYSVTLQFGQYDSHEWYGLAPAHSLFWERATYAKIISNPNHTTLKFSLDGDQNFVSPLQVAWEFSSTYYAGDSSSVDLSLVDRFLVDFYTVPSGRLADYWAIYAYDSSGGGRLMIRFTVASQCTVGRLILLGL